MQIVFLKKRLKLASDARLEETGARCKQHMASLKRSYVPRGFPMKLNGKPTQAQQRERARELGIFEAFQKLPTFRIACICIQAKCLALLGIPARSAQLC